MNDAFRNLLVVFSTVAAFQAVTIGLSEGVAVGLSVAVLAFCLGVFWGSGNTKRKLTAGQGK